MWIAQHELPQRMPPGGGCDDHCVIHYLTKRGRMKPLNLLLAVAGATIILGALVSTASAGRLSSSSQTFRAAFSRLDFSGGFGTTECAVTIEGSLHARSIVKTEGSLIGVITRVTIGTCPRGSATVLIETLPWSIRYSSFEGTLPSISSINTDVVGAGFRIREPLFGVLCLATTEEGEPATVRFNRETRGVLTSARIGGTTDTNCNIAGTFNATSFSLTVLNSVTRITVTLI